MNPSERKREGRLLAALIWVSLCWAGIGFVILAISNVILITGHTGRYGFLPIDPRNNVLTALLCLVPAAIGLVSIYLRKVLGQVT